MDEDRRSHGRYRASHSLWVAVEAPFRRGASGGVRARLRDVGLGGVRVRAWRDPNRRGVRQGGEVRAVLCVPGGVRVPFAARVLSLRRARGLLPGWEIRLSFLDGQPGLARRIYQVIDAFCGDEMLVERRDRLLPPRPIPA